MLRHSTILSPVLVLLLLISCGLAGAVFFVILFEQPGKAIIWIHLLIAYVVLNIWGHARLQSRLKSASSDDQDGK